MLAKRVPLLWAFAGGCLSGAVALGFWHELAATGSSASHQRASRASERAASPIAEASVLPEHLVRVEPADAPVEPRADSAPPKTAAPKQTIPGEAAAQNDGAELNGGPATEAGSSVADVLGQLEAAYRKDLAAKAPRDSAPVPAEVDLRAAAPATSPPAPTVAEVPRQAPPLAAIAAPAVVPAPVAAIAPAPLPAAAPAPVVVASRDEGPVAAVAAPNVSIGSIHQGDTYQTTQQIQVVQYLQMMPYLYGVNPYVPTPHGRGAHQYPNNQPYPNSAPRVPYPSTLPSPNAMSVFAPSPLWNVR